MFVFRVNFNSIWNGKGEDAGLEESPNESKTVAAEDAESAIAKVRKSEIGFKTEAVDDQDNVIDGQFHEVTEIVVHSVQFLQKLDI